MLTQGGEIYVVAEIGSNHDGSLDTAKQLITSAAMCGVNAVKFQSFHAEDLVADDHPNFDLLRRCELDEKWLPELAACAKCNGVDFLSTPFHPDWVETLVGIGVPAIKIASGDLTFTPLLEEAAMTGLPILLSTGMATKKEIWKAVDTINDFQNADNWADIYLLHCVSAYPTESKDANVAMVRELIDEFNGPVGISDHSLDPLVPVLAVANGASVVERHFTLDRSLDGPDHSFATEPKEMKELVDMLRRVEDVMGSGEMGCSKVEEFGRANYRRDSENWLRP